MSVDLESLLALPHKERKRIAEQLWESLSSTSFNHEEKEIMTLLELRWEKIKSGESKTYNSSEMREMISQHRRAK